MTKVPDHIARMIRVDQAGEFGATRIYAGQLAVMGDRGPDSAEIAGMAEQEAGHRAKFDALMARRGVRPTALQPFWDRAGFALGAVTGSMVRVIEGLEDGDEIAISGVGQLREGMRIRRFGG